MNDAMGHVTVNERAPSERFNRFVDEKLRGWMRDRGFDMAQPAEYEVAFFDEEALGEVSCLVIVQAGDQMWRAWETGDNPRTALSRSLENLKIEDEEIPSAPSERITH